MRLWLKLLVVLVIGIAFQFALASMVDRQRVWERLNAPNPGLLAMQEALRAEAESRASNKGTDRARCDSASMAMGRPGARD